MIFQTTIRRISGPLLSIRRSVSRSVRSSLARNARHTPTGRAGKLVKRTRPLLGNRFRNGFDKNAQPPKLIVSNCDDTNEGKIQLIGCIDVGDEMCWRQPCRYQHQKIVNNLKSPTSTCHQHLSISINLLACPFSILDVPSARVGFASQPF